MSDVTRTVALAGIEIPDPSIPQAQYVPWTLSGSHLYISGQVSLLGTEGYRGTVGRDINLASAQAAARICGLNLIAQMKAALDGDLDRVAKIVKLCGFVQVTEDFSQIPQVLDGCSSLMLEVFGDIGRHARSSVGVFRLPRGVAVEVDAVVEIKA